MSRDGGEERGMGDGGNERRFKKPTWYCTDSLFGMPGTLRLAHTWAHTLGLPTRKKETKGHVSTLLLGSPG